jgi:hypothetical protein
VRNPYLLYNYLYFTIHIQAVEVVTCRANVRTVAAVVGVDVVVVVVVAAAAIAAATIAASQVYSFLN